MPPHCSQIERVDPTLPTRIQRLHIKHINPLHLPQNLKPLQPSRLIEIRRDSARLRSRGKQVVH